MAVKVREARDFVLEDKKGEKFVLVQVGIGIYKLYKYIDGKPDLNRFSDEEFSVTSNTPEWLRVTDQHLGYWQPKTKQTMEKQITKLAQALASKRSDIAEILVEIANGTWDGDLSGIESRLRRGQQQQRVGGNLAPTTREVIMSDKPTPYDNFLVRAYSSKQVVTGVCLNTTRKEAEDYIRRTHWYLENAKFEVIPLRNQFSVLHIEHRQPN